MSEPGTASSFDSTSWSLVLSAGSDPAHLEKLLRVYAGPIYAFVRRSGYGRDEAAELAQEFILQVVLERNLVAKADQDRGRFRTFLKAALRNFLVDQHRRAGAKGRRTGAAVFGGSFLHDFEPCETDDPSRAFERQWATTILSRTLERLEADCIACGQEQHWAAFRMVVIEPAVAMTSGGGQGPRPLAEVAGVLDIPSADQVSSMILTIRRKFRRLLIETVGETLENPAEAPDEVARIQDWLTT